MCVVAAPVQTPAQALSICVDLKNNFEKVEEVYEVYSGISQVVSMGSVGSVQLAVSELRKADADVDLAGSC